MNERLDLKKFTEHMGYTNAPFHTEWYTYLQNRFSPLKLFPDREKRALRLWPRGHGKSETTDINYLSWLIGNFPDIHVNIVTKTSSLAEQILTALMTRFETDERYIEVFGNLKPEHTRKWTSREIIVNRSEISKNPTVKATGLLGTITGGRSDLVVFDDIIDEENVRTRLQLEKVLTWVDKVCIPTLYPWGGALWIGTRWSYADIYSVLMERIPFEIKKAIINEETRQVLWPTYWNYNRLVERRKEIGSIFFNCQYQNDPTGMEGELLKSEWLHPYISPPKYTKFYAGVDPALGEGDLQAVASLAVDQNGQGYLVDVWAEKQPFPNFLRKLHQLHNLYHYAKIYMESNAFQKVLTYIQELRGLPTVPTPTHRDKETRFIAMSSHFESERVLVNPLLLNHSEFWTEWVQFPRGQYDDALDSVEIVTRNIVGGARGFFA